MKLRTAFMLLLPTVALATSIIVAGLALQLRLPKVEQEQNLRADESAHVVAISVDNALSTYEVLLRQTAIAAERNQQRKPDLKTLLATNRSILAAYVLDANGKVLSIYSQNNSGIATDSSISRLNIDALPEFNSALDKFGLAWTDRLLSIVTGDVVIAVGVKMGSHRLMIEIPPEALNIQIGVVIRPVSLPILVLDGAGQWVASNNEIFGNRYSNFSAEPSLRAALRGEASPVFQSQGNSYHIASARLERLSWTFAIAVPTGYSNPHYRDTVVLTGVGVIVSTLLALLLAPWLSTRAARPVVALTDKSSQLSSGTEQGDWPRSHISEINDLSANFQKMVAAVREREFGLRELNENLEARVNERTSQLSSANNELETTLSDLRNAQSMLVEREKNAALGSMVAGVAHELNTPIGNALISASSLQEEMKALRTSMAQGTLKRSSFDYFLNEGGMMTDLIQRSCHRAAELISSFKRVTVDQSSENRNHFDLRELIEDYLETLRPTYKIKPWIIINEVPGKIACDSYPGALGQIITNLVQNAMVHAFEGKSAGIVRIQAEEKESLIYLRVTDDGHGMTPAVLGRIFDPFFTTRMGTGGSGLGLSISLRLAAKVLGGRLTARSQVNEGTSFTLMFPHSAPRSVEY